MTENFENFQGGHSAPFVVGVNCGKNITGESLNASSQYFGKILPKRKLLRPIRPLIQIAGKSCIFPISSGTNVSEKGSAINNAIINRNLVKEILFSPNKTCVQQMTAQDSVVVYQQPNVNQNNVINTNGIIQNCSQSQILGNSLVNNAVTNSSSVVSSNKTCVPQMTAQNSMVVYQQPNVNQNNGSNVINTNSIIQNCNQSQNSMVVYQQPNVNQNNGNNVINTNGVIQNCSQNQNSMVVYQQPSVNGNNVINTNGVIQNCNQSQILGNSLVNNAVTNSSSVLSSNETCVPQMTAQDSMVLYQQPNVYQNNENNVINTHGIIQNCNQSHILGNSLVNHNNAVTNSSSVLSSNAFPTCSSNLQNETNIPQIASQTAMVVYQPNVCQNVGESNSVNASGLIQNYCQGNMLKLQSVGPSLINQPVPQAVVVVIPQSNGKVISNENNQNDVTLSNNSGNQHASCLLPYSQVQSSVPGTVNFMIYNNNLLSGNGTLSYDLKQQQHSSTFVAGSSSPSMSSNISQIPNQINYLLSNYGTGVCQNEKQNFQSQNKMVNKNISQQSNSILFVSNSGSSIQPQPSTPSVNKTVRPVSETENVTTMKIGDKIKISLPVDVAKDKGRLKEFINEELSKAMQLNDSGKLGSNCLDSNVKSKSNNTEIIDLTMDDTSNCEFEDNCISHESPLPNNNDNNNNNNNNSDFGSPSKTPPVLSSADSLIRNTCNLTESPVNTSNCEFEENCVSHESPLPNDDDNDFGNPCKTPPVFSSADRLIRNICKSTETPVDSIFPNILSDNISENKRIKLENEIAAMEVSDTNSSANVILPDKNLDFFHSSSNMILRGKHELGTVERVLSCDTIIQTSSDCKPFKSSFSNFAEFLNLDNSIHNNENQELLDTINKDLHTSMGRDSFFSSKIQQNSKINLPDQMDEEMLEDPLYVDNENLTIMTDLPDTQVLENDPILEEFEKDLFVNEEINIKLERIESTETPAEEVLSVKTCESLAVSENERPSLGCSNGISKMEVCCGIKKEVLSPDNITEENMTSDNVTEENMSSDNITEENLSEEIKSEQLFYDKLAKSKFPLVIVKKLREEDLKVYCSIKKDVLSYKNFEGKIDSQLDKLAKSRFPLSIAQELREEGQKLYSDKEAALLSKNSTNNLGGIQSKTDDGDEISRSQFPWRLRRN